MLFAVVAGLSVPAFAHAAPSDINVQFGLPPTASAVAAEETEYTITFQANAGLDDNPGTAVVINAAGAGLAPGTVFPPSAPPTSDAGAVYTVGSGGSNGLVVAPVQLSNGGQTVVIPTFSTGVDAAPGDTVTVTIGYINEKKVLNPAAPCTCKLALRTTVGTDAVFGLSDPYEVVESDGHLTAEDGDGQTTQVGSTFAEPLKVKLVDGSDSPIEGATVTFTTPVGEVPSGTFAGGTEDGHSFDAVTDAGGVATSSALTANGEAGTWDAKAEVDPETFGQIQDATFDLQNTVGDASEITLEVSPEEISGDGVSKTAAIATVNDEFGNRLTNRDVTFESSGDQRLTQTQNLGGGRYRVGITSTPEAGTFTITATDEDGLFIFDTFEQIADTTGPKVTITDGPPKKGSERKVRFNFDSNQPDVDFFECKLDDRDFRACKGPKDYGVRKGDHVFRVRATDLSGNTGPVDKYKFERIDRAS